MRGMWRKAVAGVALAAGAGLAGCATNPVTGERELALISEQQEIQMGAQAAEQVAQSIGLVDDAELQAYIQRLGESIARTTERPNLPWTFGVVDDPTPNAFALPGGYIYFTRGLMSLMDSEAELAAVLGHEIGHVTARHSVSQLSRAQLAQLGLGIGMILSPTIAQFGEVAVAGLQLLFLKHGRDDERQADELGFRYASGGGYDVREMDDVFVSLSRIAGIEQRSSLPSWLSTHPAPEERVEAMRRRAQQLGAEAATGRAGKPEYMRQIDGMVYGVNPRQGFFEGTTFLHPDLRFRIDFPSGWPTQNLPQVVAAGSPQQDALIQLTLAQGSAQQAANAFLGQQGVQPGQASRETINGLPAVAATFQAQTEQGVLRGLALFVEHGGRTYQILAYTPAQRFGAYDGVFRQTLGSFRPLTDARALDAQPKRIDTVTLSQAMTLAQFQQRYPSSIPIEELAIINQVESGSSTIPAGSILKRVQ